MNEPGTHFKSFGLKTACAPSRWWWFTSLFSPLASCCCYSHTWVNPSHEITDRSRTNLIYLCALQGRFDRTKHLGSWRNPLTEAAEGWSCVDVLCVVRCLQKKTVVEPFVISSPPSASLNRTHLCGPFAAQTLLNMQIPVFMTFHMRERVMRFLPADHLRPQMQCKVAHCRAPCPRYSAPATCQLTQLPHTPQEKFVPLHILSEVCWDFFCVLKAYSTPGRM